MSRVIIIDASVAAKWLLDDEESVYANKIKNEFLDNKVSIQVPIVIYSEVNNLLKSAILSQRINFLKALKVYQSFLDLDFTTFYSKELFVSTLNIALNLGISSYDASYVALVEYLKIPLFTADEKLVKKANSSLVKSLEDYS